jgi:hypothetical protein
MYDKFDLEKLDMEMLKNLDDWERQQLYTQLLEEVLLQVVKESDKHDVSEYEDLL